MNKNLLMTNRIVSIDALRGFDMLLIIFADRFFISLNEGAGTSFLSLWQNNLIILNGLVLHSMIL